MWRWLVFFIILIALDIYAFQAVRTFFRSPYITVVYFLVSFLAAAGLVYDFSFLGSSKLMAPPRVYFLGIFLVVFGPKLLLVLFMLLEDIIRLISSFFMSAPAGSDSFMPSRRKFVSTIALGLAAIPFTSLIYGMVKGKYNFKVFKYILEFEDLPEEFDGYKITQLSDIHSGSFDSKEKVQYGVNLANEQESDILVLTGDLVNNVAEEMVGWESVFSQLKARDGVYSVLGNHDYGDYVRWNSNQEKAENLQKIKAVQKAMGWDLLLNEHRILKRGEATLALVGVENWGEGFKKVGDLDKACKGLDAQDFKILLSHDPTHWEQEVKTSPHHVSLTLSGHTHGMQFGIEIPNWFRWSPAKLRYKHWAGIYEENKRYLNVNRGFGYLAYPGRVGIWPEISVIELRKKSKLR